MSRAAGEGRLRELDGWRAVSVLLVILSHLGAYQYQRFVSPHVHLAATFANFGPLGVKVFFVISGFVICRLLILEEKRYGDVSLKGFYIRRAFRILPPLYLYLLLLSLLLAAGLIVESWGAIRSAALFLYDIVPARPADWRFFVGHTWSLAVEEQFYLTFPTLLVLTLKIGRGPFFFGLFGLLAAWNFVCSLHGWNQFTTPPVRSGFACISCGVLMALFETRARAIARTIPTLVVAAVGLTLFWHPNDTLSWVSALYDSVYTPLAIALVLIFSLARELRLRAFLCWKPVQAVGLTSYGIYLWQELLTAPSGFYTASGKPISRMLPLLFVIIPLSWFFIEKPAMRLGRSLSEKVRGEPVLETGMR
jgi:peptidoglycan/LPS O-acetylase OafA/YrhL